MEDKNKTRQDKTKRQKKCWSLLSLQRLKTKTRKTQDKNDQDQGKDKGKDKGRGKAKEKGQDNFTCASSLFFSSS
jgi:hypothetical protein